MRDLSQRGDSVIGPAHLDLKLRDWSLQKLNKQTIKPVRTTYLQEPVANLY